MNTRDFLCQVLRCEAADWSVVTPLRGRELFALAHREGVHLLLAHRIRHDASGARCPDWLRLELERVLHGETAADQIICRELKEVLRGLNEARVQALLFKGGALAFTHYRDPVLRPHVDIDLLVRPRDVRTAARLLSRRGYEFSPCVTGDLVSSGACDESIEQYLVSSQIPYHRADEYGFQHAFDLHWSVAIPQTFARLLTFDELRVSAAPLPQLGPDVLAVGALHSLVIACVHRVAHHHNDDRLIWFYDIHLLANGLADADIEGLLQFARHKRIAAICERGLSLAQETFGTRLPHGLLEELRARSGGEASAVYLRRNLRQVDVLRSDLAALDSWRQRLRLLAGHVFPPAAYMRRIYGASSWPWLLILYTWRIVTGARGWFRGSAVR